MGKRKDRERAEKGLLWRDGKLVPAENEPGSEARKQVQQKVEAVAKMYRKEKGE